MEIPPIIEVVPYNPHWPRFFEAEAEILKGALGKNCVTVYHIGSTSVPGLAAKPIIDIMVVVKDILEVDSQLANFEELGYVANGEFGIPFRRYFHKGNILRTHNIHIYEEGSHEIERHLHFKEYLKANPDISQEYETLKLALAKQHPYSIADYNNGKDAFIHEIDQKVSTNKLRMVIARTDREWQSVSEFRHQQYIATGISDILIKENHCHLILLQGASIIGYADLILDLNANAQLAMLVLKKGFEYTQEEFIVMIKRWMFHQGRTFTYKAKTGQK